MVLEASRTVEVDAPIERCYELAANIEGAPDWQATLLDVEVLSALRRLVDAGEVLAERAEEAIEDLALLRIARHGHLDLATRAWELRQNFTAYDAVYLALAESLDATVVTDRREISADAFFRGLFATALQPGEVITSLRFPVPDAGGYAKFKSPASRYAVVGVCVARKAGKVRLAVTGAGPCVFRVGAMEAALERSFAPGAIAAIRLDSENLTSDIHADAEYRAHLVTVMAKKAVAAALQTS